MVRRRAFLKGATTAAGGVTIAGCTGEGPDDSAPDEEPSPSPEPTTPEDGGEEPTLADRIRIGFASPAMALYKFAIWPALERSVAEAGSQLETDRYGGHVPVAGGLISEEIVTGYVSVPAIAEARLQGMPLVGIHTNLQEYFFPMVAQPEIESWEDLRGSSIAIHAPVGTSAAIANQMVLEELGSLDAVNYSYIIGSGSRLAALESGEVDATVILGTPALQAVNEGFGHILAWPGDYDRLDFLITNTWTALEPRLDERSGELQLIVDQLQNAYDWLYEGDTGEIVDEALATDLYPGYDRSVWIEALEIARDIKLWPESKAAGLDTQRIDNTLQLLSDLDLIDEEAVLPADDLIDRRFLD